MRARPVITIDGPSGAGKTTVSRRLAERTGLIRLDTGAMYRACALAAQRAGIPWTDGGRVGRLSRELPLAFVHEGAGVRILVSGEDVSDAIRTPEMGMGASTVSTHPAVREAMVALQRRLGEAGGIVAEGRDTGTVVFPDADAKFFLDAVAVVRAMRRHREWGEEKRPSFEETLADVLRRDIQDCTREHSPLRVADGAVYVDTTTLSVDEVVDTMLRALPAPLRAAPSGSPASGGTT